MRLDLKPCGVLSKLGISFYSGVLISSNSMNIPPLPVAWRKPTTNYYCTIPFSRSATWTTRFCQERFQRRVSVDVLPSPLLCGWRHACPRLAKFATKKNALATLVAQDNVTGRPPVYGVLLYGVLVCTMPQVPAPPSWLDRALLVPRGRSLGDRPCSTHSDRPPEHAARNHLEVTKSAPRQPQPHSPLSP